MKRRKRREHDLEREIKAHLDLEAEEFGEHGARKTFGNVALVKEACREVWGWTSLDRLRQDLRYGFRMLRRSPGFTFAAIVSLALGIGANTAIFTLINTLMLKSLPVQDPARLVVFQKHYAGGKPGNIAWPVYQQIRDHNSVYSGVLAHRPLPERKS